MGHTTEQKSSEISFLYERYASIILNYIRRHISSDADAEDILVDVFMAAFENVRLPNIEDSAQLAWLRRVAHNKCIDFYRKAYRRPVTSLESIQETVPFYDEEERSPEQTALRQEEYRILYEHLTTLPVQHQEIIRLRFGAGMRCVEIAKKLHLPEGTVRGWLSRSLNLLRTIYEKQGENR